jgi:AcrR family transcriptional regulator
LLFAEQGYAQTTFKHIGQAMGVSHAALYAYFPSKKELYLAVVADAQALLLPYYVEAFEKGTTLKERICHILLATAKENDKDSSITGLLAAVPIEIRRHPELYEAVAVENNVLMQSLAGMFEEAQRNGEIVLEASPSDLIAALLGGGVGVALFQYGLREANLSRTMEIFTALIDGKLFQH